MRIRPPVAALVALIVISCGGKESETSEGSGGSPGTGGSVTSGGMTSGGMTSGGTTSGGATNGGSTSGGAANGGTANGGTANGGAGGSSMGGAKATGGSTSGSGLPALHVDGRFIKDPSGKTIVLRGVDLIDIGALYAYGNQNAAAITARIDKILAAGLTPHVMRIPVYPRVSHNTPGPAYSSPAPFPVGSGGTANGPSAERYVTDLLKPTVDYITQKGMYAIIDFHQIDNTDGASATEATAFWQFMAAKFADYSNVLYEPYNEPIDSAMPWATFKNRAQGWVDTIRAAAPNNLIIVPSMAWDQHPGDAASAPLAGANLVYAAHIYPGNWNATFQQQLATATAKVPVFISEWGYMQNSSDAVGGTSDPNWFSDFRAIVDGNGASWSAWVTDNSWTPNMFSSNALTTLSDFGSKTKTWLTEKATSDWVR